MFQAMAEYQSEYTSLEQMFDTLKTAFKVNAYTPGSLGQTVKENQMIGSLSIKHDNVSLLIFKNGKVKISGGYRDFDPAVSSILIYLLDIAEHTCRDIGLSLKLETFRIFLLNGMFRLDPFTPKDYFTKIVPRIGDYFDRVRLPKSLGIEPNTVIKGRIVALHIKTDEGTLQFDHKGCVQLFGFKTIEAMMNVQERLINVINKLRE